jgi:phospholipid/cholesterol/gamma-HCH transport system substrate-binding protein
MEFNARYAVTGVFAIAVIAAVFGFVYWLRDTGGFGAETQYQVRFTVPVSGLATGSGVLFNGIKVGEVQGIRFDPDQPGSLLARIAISRETPLRTDTIAGIDYQGLTGAANVMLTGGTADAPLLEATDGGVPEIVAEPAASRSWTQNAARVLGRLDDLLGRNSGRFDAILSGLERLAGGSEKNTSAVYELAAPQFTEPARERTWQLAVAEPSVMLSLNTDKILREPEAGQIDSFENARWADNLPNLFQTQIVRSFENAGYTDGVLRPGDALDPDYKLVIDIRAFHLSTAASPQARIDYVAKLVNREGGIVASRAFSSTAPAESAEAPVAAKALSGLFASSMSELVNWTVSAI